MKMNVVLGGTRLRYRLVAALLFLAAALARAEPAPLVVEAARGRVDLMRHAEYLFDPGRHLTLTELLMPGASARFVSAAGAVPHFSYADGAHWLRVRLAPEVALARYLRFGFARLDQVEGFLVGEDGIRPLGRSGQRVPLAERALPARLPVLPVALQPGGEPWLYLRIEHRGETQLALSLVDRDELARAALNYGLYAAAYNGLLLALMLLAGVLYGFRRDRLNLLYAGYVGAWMLTLLYRDGSAQLLGAGLIGPEAHRWLDPLFGTFALPILFTGFSVAFLQTRRWLPRLTRGLLTALGLALAVQVLGLLLPSFAAVSFRLAGISFILLELALLATAFALYRMGHRQGLHYLLAFSLFLAGAVGFLLTQAGVLPLDLFIVEDAGPVLNFLLQHPARISILFEFSFFAALLVRRYRELADRHERAQAELLEQQRAHSRDIERKNLELQGLDRLKDEFLANASHELKTPIQGLIGLAEGMASEVGASPELAQQVAVMRHSALRLGRLVDDLLDLSALQADAPRLAIGRVDLPSVVDAAVALMRPGAQAKGLELKWAAPDEFPAVRADEDRLQQVLLNLIGNAIKYTGRGEVRLELAPVDGMAAIDVIDTGEGIAPEDQQAIFERFRRVGQAGASGLGLGLTISRELVELQGGRLTVASEPQSGSRFRVTLPFAEAQEGARVAHARAAVAGAVSPGIPSVEVPAAPRRPGQRCVLLVDDEAINLFAVGSLLRQQDYHVLTATDGLEALQALEDHAVDLVLLDLMMPRMNGFEACRRIREQYPADRLPVLMLTARPRDASIAESFRCGASDYIEKPVRSAELLARVAAHLELKALAHLRQHAYLLDQLRRAWEQSQQGLRAFLDQIRDAVLLLDGGLAVRHANSAAGWIADGLPGGLAGASLPALLPDEAADALNRFVAGDRSPASDSCFTREDVALRSRPARSCDLLVMPLVREEPLWFCLLRSRGEGVSPAAEDRRRALVELMTAALELWEACSGKDKYDLAEQSGLWRVQIDQGRLRTRVMDRYCQLRTLPRYPRWMDVVRTAEFVRAELAGRAGGDERLAALARATRRMRDWVALNPAG